MTLAFDYMILADALERSAQQVQRLAFVDHEDTPLKVSSDPIALRHLANACRSRAIAINPACEDPFITTPENKEGPNT